MAQQMARMQAWCNKCARMLSWCNKCARMVAWCNNGARMLAWYNKCARMLAWYNKGEDGCIEYPSWNIVHECTSTAQEDTRYSASNWNVDLGGYNGKIQKAEKKTCV